MSTWTNKDDDFLVKNYPLKTAKEIASKLGRTRSAIKNRVNVLGIKLPENIREERIKKGMYRKGQTPFNKGKKLTDFMSDEAISRVKESQFKKGQKPHNTKVDNDVSIIKDKSGRSYKKIKTSDNCWELLHRKVWQEANGSIPKNGVIRFKNGDTMNCELDNLELITLADNMKLNSIQRFPVELIELIKLNSKLNRKITSKKQQHG